MVYRKHFFRPFSALPGILVLFFSTIAEANVPHFWFHTSCESELIGFLPDTAPDVTDLSVIARALRTDRAENLTTVRYHQIDNLVHWLRPTYWGEKYDTNFLMTLFNPGDQLYAFDGNMIRARPSPDIAVLDWSLEIVPKELIQSVVSTFNLSEKAMTRSWLKERVFPIHPDLVQIGDQLSGLYSLWRIQDGATYARLQLHMTNGLTGHRFGHHYFFLFLRIQADGSGMMNLALREMDADSFNSENRLLRLRSLAETDGLNPELHHLFRSTENSIAFRDTSTLIALIREIAALNALRFNSAFPFAP